MNEAAYVRYMWAVGLAALSVALGWAAAFASMMVWPIVIGGPLGSDTPMDHLWFLRFTQSAAWIVAIPILASFYAAWRVAVSRRPMTASAVWWLVASLLLPLLCPLGGIIGLLFLPIALRLSLIALVGGVVFTIGILLLSRRHGRAGG